MDTTNKRYVTLWLRTFRDSNGRLRGTLYVNGAPRMTKPLERVCDGAPPEDRHRYNVAKVFGLYPFNAAQTAALEAGEEVKYEIE